MKKRPIDKDHSKKSGKPWSTPEDCEDRNRKKVMDLLIAVVNFLWWSLVGNSKDSVEPWMP